MTDVDNLATKAALNTTATDVTNWISNTAGFITTPECIKLELNWVLIYK